MWIKTLRRDLVQDSVSAPGDADQRWLLYPSAVTTDDGTGAVVCPLCKRCRAAFSRVQGSAKTSRLRVPDVARASGMWRGPDPEELNALSYFETKVINLARVFVSVKRIFLDRRSDAGTSASEAPLYHQRIPRLT